MSDPSVLPSSPDLTPAPRPGCQDWLFRGNSWIAAIARLILYVLVVAAAVALLRPLVRLVHRPSLSPLDPMNFFYAEASLVIAVLFGALVLSLLEKRRPGVYGLPLRFAFGKLFWQGCLAGLLEVSALIGLIAAFRGYAFGGLAVHGFELARWLVFWAVFFVLVGFFEEFLFRGYPQYTLGMGLGFWPAAILLSVGFGAVHLGNPGEGWVGALSVVIIGLILCLSLKRTGSLWFAVGLHASFDFGETFLYSVPNSGFVASGHLSNATLHGAAWLTGGTVGPEGSAFSFLTMGILCYAIHKLYPAKEGAAGET
jgi:membrane protease YdiL (CAAX protease family)